MPGMEGRIFERPAKNELRSAAAQHKLSHTHTHTHTHTPSHTHTRFKWTTPSFFHDHLVLWALMQNIPSRPAVFKNNQDRDPGSITDAESRYGPVTLSSALPHQASASTEHACTFSLQFHLPLVQAIRCKDSSPGQSQIWLAK